MEELGKLHQPQAQMVLTIKQVPTAEIQASGQHLLLLAAFLEETQTSTVWSIGWLWQQESL
jgi:hypothetical protein